MGYLSDIVELLPFRVAERRKDDVGFPSIGSGGILGLAVDEVSRTILDLEGLRPCTDSYGSPRGESPVRPL